jgi:hypothetical protein
MNGHRSRDNIMPDDIIARARRGEIVAMSGDELAELRQRAELIEEKDTYLSDMIRLLRLGDLLLVQETTDKKEIIIRAMPSLDEARAFIDRRMETYERMWDGCGCSVTYFDE